MSLKRRFLAGCWFSHSSQWTQVRINGVLYRQCDRCQQHTTALLVNVEAEDIKPAKTPEVRQRHAIAVKPEKKKRVRKPRVLPTVLKIERRA